MSCHGVLFALPISSKPVFWPTSEWPTIRELSRRLHGHSVTKQAFLTSPRPSTTVPQMAQ